MAKRFKSSSGNFARKAVSSPKMIPNRTVGPGTTLETAETVWFDDSTSSETPKPQAKSYASGGTQLLEKYIQGDVPIKVRSLISVLTIILFAVISWLFLQDNQADKLKDFAGIKWWAFKAGTYTTFYVVFAILIILISKIGKNE